MRSLKRGGVRLVYDIVREPGADYPKLGAAPDLVSLYRCLQAEHTIPREREAFVVFGLDNRHKVVLVHLVSVGTLNSSLVHPREVFRPAVAAGCAAVAVAHHHPSGYPEPSPEDRAVTDRLREAGNLLGINLVDHVILGTDTAYSFAEEGMIPA